ncbi:MAG TPA: chemotaxis protein CheB [Ktedonobacter sp.]|nr:chemotaxis protein CheB [Ktedonobacter sp.]
MYMKNVEHEHEAHEGKRNGVYGHDMIAIGASAGGVEALMRLVRDLPRSIHAALFIVLHIPADSPSLLPELLSRSGALPASHAVDGQEIQHGHIYVASPDHHLLVEKGRMRVVQGPKENRHRPAIDPLFRSLALAYGSRAIGVVLTGALDDGTAGLLAIKRRNGLAIVQDPADALYPSMPESALAHVNVDYKVPLVEIAPLLTRLSKEVSQHMEKNALPEDMEIEVRMAEADLGVQREDKQVGNPSAYSCPECGGVLWEIQEGELVRYRCRVGHAFSMDSMLAGQSEALEDAIWVAFKIVQEQAAMARRVAEQMEAKGRTYLARRYEERQRDSEQRASLLLKALKRLDPVTPEDLAETNTVDTSESV